MLIDMSIPTERNTSLKTAEKLSKHKDLEIELEKTWGLKTTVPVIIGALGVVKKGIESYIGKIPGNIRIAELQKTVFLGTAHTAHTKEDSIHQIIQQTYNCPRLMG